MPSMSFLSHLTIQINVKDHPFSVELQIKKVLKSTKVLAMSKDFVKTKVQPC